MSTTTTTTQLERAPFTPISVASEPLVYKELLDDVDDVDDEDDDDDNHDTNQEEQRDKQGGNNDGNHNNDSTNNKDGEDHEYHSTTRRLPVYTAKQVARNNGDNDTPIWMTYGGIIYDVTDFIQNHPGGSEKILMAAGSALEPYWHIYRQHFASELPLKLMEHMVVGRLRTVDQEAIDEQMELLTEENEDPYASEPERHRDLRIHADTPMNAEVPTPLLTKSYLTPNSLFYIRHHHPVPPCTKEMLQNYSIQLDLTAIGLGIKSVTLEQLQSMPTTDIIATLQCSGNRRSGFNEVQRTTGTPWIQGAISTAKFTGVKLTDLLKSVGLIDAIAIQDQHNVHHVRFFSRDGMSASIGIEKACNPYGDVMIAWKMNDEPLPPDHGYPVRVVVPGYAAVRSVKWLERIEVSAEEAEGPWQRGLNYKILPPSVTDARDVDISKMPSVMEVSVNSGITEMKIISTVLSETNGHTAVPETTQPLDGKYKEGDQVLIAVSGWAFAGGGRKVARVDLTGNDGLTWHTAEITAGDDQRSGRAWAWVFWETTLPCRVNLDERGNPCVQIASKAMDSSLNIQPESCRYNWNVRGLGNNSWYRAQLNLPSNPNHRSSI